MKTIHLAAVLTLLALLALLGSASLSAQTASYVYIDQQAPWSNPSPAFLVARNVPRVGTGFDLDVPWSWRQRNGVGADYVLATGIGNPGIPFAVFGGYLYTTADVLLPTPMSPLGTPGRTSLILQIPLSRALLGLHFYQQILEAQVKPTVLRLGRGGHGVIGI